MTTRIAYFFVPLPEPLGLPDGYVARTFQPADWTAWEREAVRTAGAAPMPPPPEEYLEISICLHQTEQRDPMVETVDSLMKVVNKAFPTLEDPEHEDLADPSVPTRPLTVAEVAVFLPQEFTGSDPPSWSAGEFNEALSSAFDAGLVALRRIQETHYLTTGRAVTLCVRERLPMMVPFTIRVLEDGETELEPPVAVSLFITRLDDAAVRVPFDGAQLRLFNEGAQALDVDRAFSTLPGLRNAAAAALDAGQYLQAVVLVATTCEVFLGDLLSHMLWEECVTPVAAATVVNQPFAAKLKSEYHGRLGGRWITTGTGPIAEYERELLHLRHRAVHSGLHPSLEEARSAFSAAGRLEQFIGDRLAVSVRRYPITAIMFCGRPGLERRGAFTRFVEDIGDDPTEVRWIETFGRWRRSLTWCIEAMAGEQPSPDLARATTALTIGADGVERWWRVDREAYVACPAVRPVLQPGHASAIEQMQADAKAHPDSGPRSAFIRDVTAEPALPLQWMRLDQVLPLHFVMRDRSDLPGVAPPSVVATGRPQRRSRAPE